MKTLSAALLTELGLSVTRPGYLISLGFSVDLYLSTMGDISWAGQAWSGKDVKVSGISQDGSGATAKRRPVQVFSGVTDGADIDTHANHPGAGVAGPRALYHSPRAF